jgi:hypothetical protein
VTLLDHVELARQLSFDESIEVAERYVLLRADHLLEAEVACARQYGVARSRLRGGDGTWSDDDRWFAIAYERLLRERCAHCGTFDDEWIDPETKQARGLPPYESKAVKCWGCNEIEEELKDLRNRGGDRAGVFVRLVPYVDRDEDGWEDRGKR